ncbi:hypothetical protein NE865_05982 [Phthorimaea operculella]|nr:hypothetical protein NE865_05982 [Phthorimaea operculella]
MPCGKRPLVKTWDEPRDIRTVKPSRYQQNEPSVKQHWKKYMRDLELGYKDEKFWETQSHLVRDLVGPVIFQRLTKIFSLPKLDAPYQPASEPSIIIPSEQYYIKSTVAMSRSGLIHRSLDSLSDSDNIDEEGEEEEATSLDYSWSTSTKLDAISTMQDEKVKKSKSKINVAKSKSRLSVSKSAKSLALSAHKLPSMSKSMIMSRVFHRGVDKSFSNKYMEKISEPSTMGTAHSADDVAVHARSHKERPQIQRLKGGLIYNPHFELLYCAESETDMIKWESKYRKKTQEVSASEEYHNKAELLTKHIAGEFYSWWISVGSADYKSEIKCPEDLESLFQIWFDEHASRGLVLDPKLLPCVLQTIADYCGVPNASCPNALKRQIAWDIHAETSPAHTRAFNSSLPQKLKHIPPQNKTAEMWKPVDIPEDLKSMTAVWGDISHLTSTKAFAKWLQQRPYLPMPPCLKELEQPGEKKQLFVQPSDFILREQKSESFDNELNIPISEFSLEIKEVISKMLQD